jgi:hypothetical protein
MSRIAFADTATTDGKGGVAAAEKTCPVSGFADVVTAASEDLQDFRVFFGNLSVPRSDAATGERIALLLKARLEGASSDARREDLIDPKGNAATRFARIVREAKRDIAACDLAAMKAVGWNDDEIAEIVLHVAANAMLSTLDRFGEVGFPSGAPGVRAS